MLLCVAGDRNAARPAAVQRRNSSVITSIVSPRPSQVKNPRTTAAKEARSRAPGDGTGATSGQPTTTGLLQQELRQTKSFASVHAEAFLNIVRTADRMQHLLHMKLKPYGITETQYNSLRILRGAGKQGLSCAEIGERLISQDPDITRLLGRLERQGLVRRERGESDRRVVVTKITSSGLERLKELDPVVTSAVHAMLDHLSEKELGEMISLLERSRSTPTT